MPLRKGAATFSPVRHAGFSERARPHRSPSWPVVAFLMLSIGHDSIWFTRSYIDCVSSLITLERGQQHSSRRNIAGHMEKSTYTGFRDLTVDDVCTEAGVSKGAFYGYFEHKQVLLLALLDDDSAALDAELEAITGASSSGVERVRRFAQAMLARGDDPARVQVRADLWAARLTEDVVREHLAVATQQRRSWSAGGSRKLSRQANWSRSPPTPWRRSCSH